MLQNLAAYNPKSTATKFIEAMNGPNLIFDKSSAYEKEGITIPNSLSHSKEFLLTNCFQLIILRQMIILQKHYMKSKFSGLLKWYFAYKYLFTSVRIDDMIM